MPVSFLFSVLKGAPPLALWGVILVLFLGLISLGAMYKNALKENANLEVKQQVSEQNALNLQNALKAQNAKIEALRVDNTKVQVAQSEVEKLYLQAKTSGVQNAPKEARLNAQELAQKHNGDCQAQLEAINGIAEVFFRE